MWRAAEFAQFICDILLSLEGEFLFAHFYSKAVRNV